MNKMSMFKPIFKEELTKDDVFTRCKECAGQLGCKKCDYTGFIVGEKFKSIVKHPHSCDGCILFVNLDCNGATGCSSSIYNKYLEMKAEGLL